MFDKLPTELIVEILSYCKVIPLTLVCRQFNDLISNSPYLMRKVNLLINERTNYQNIVEKGSRKYQNILIKFNYKIDRNILDVLNRFSDHIKHLEIMRCILSEHLFAEMINCLPHLEILSIYTTYLRCDFPMLVDVEPIDCLNSLKSLNFRNSDQKFLRILKNSNNLKSINLSLPHQYPASVITEFFDKKDSIRVIESLMVSEIERTIFHQVLFSKKNLRKLSIEIDKIKMDDIRDMELENTSVEFLNLYGSSADPADFNIVINFFKNIKHLEIELYSLLEQNMINLTRIGNKIESLKIMNCSGDFFNHILLPNLLSFEILDASFITLNDWTIFAQRNRKVEKLIIKDEAVTDEMFVAITQEFSCLKYLEMFYDPQRLTNDILNYICDTSFPRNIRTVKIKKRQWQQYSNSFFTLTENHKEKLYANNLGFNLILR